MTVKQFLLAVLNGESIGVIIALLPSALLNQLLTTAFPHSPLVAQITAMTALVQSLLPVIAAFAVGNLLKFHIVDSASVALAAFVAGGVTTATANGVVIAGTGIITNMLITILVASAVVLLIGNRLGQFKMLVEPLVVLLVAGGIGLITLKPVAALQHLVGVGVANATHLTPLVMGGVLGLLFAALIVSPLSSVGVATAISLAGVGSGAANAGIVAASFTLALMGARVNPLGGTIAHFMGSPKIQMANMLSKPKLFIPVLLAALVSGASAAALQMQGTPFSAGFGFSGLIGPLTAWQNSTGPLLGVRVLLAFVIIPAVIAVIINYVFVRRFKFINETDVQLPEI